jgi:hypothetical protein
MQLKLKDFCLGRLINFGDEHVKNGIRRITNNLQTLSFASLSVPLREALKAFTRKWVP